MIAGVPRVLRPARRPDRVSAVLPVSSGRAVFDNPNLSRPRFLAGGVSASAAVATRCASTADPSARLRVMLNGGVYEEIARRLVVQPFERDTGARVEIVPGSAAEMITRLRAERSAPTVDVAIVDRLVIGANLD